jgi:fucose permease
MLRRLSPILVPLAFLAFVSLGLPDCVLGVAWPSIRADFHQSLSQLGPILIGGAAGYLLSAFFAGQIVRTIGVGKLLLASALTVVLSLIAYALAPAFPVIVLAAVIGGLGAGAIDAGINTFAASHFSPRVINWLHASWGIGATTGPLLMTTVLAAHHGWRTGYVILAGAMAILSLLFLATLRLWEDAAPANTGPQVEHHTATLSQALRQPTLWIQSLLFFVYTGIESTAGQLLYTLFTEHRGINPTTAGITVGGYWGALTIGRIIFGQLAASLTRRTILRIGMILALIAAILIAWNPAPTISLGGMALLGFALAPIFPTLISATPATVGPRYAPHAVGFQVAAASLGIAAFPALVSLLARAFGLEFVCTYLVAAIIFLIALHELTTRLAETAPPLQVQRA